MLPLRDADGDCPSWIWDGNRDALTLSPSIHHIGHWHGLAASWGVGAGMSETKIPGLKVAHQLITPECRSNRGSGAFDEAVRRLAHTYGNYAEEPANAGVTWHLLLTRAEPEANPPPPEYSDEDRQRWADAHKSVSDPLGR